MTDRDRELHEMADEGRALMSDYIKREDAIKVACGDCPYNCSEVRKKEHPCMEYKELMAIPSADAAPVVRCKDCKFAHMTYGGECKYCDVWESEDSLYLDGDFFCAFGKRKDDE